MRNDNYHQEWIGETEQQVMDHAFYNTVMYLPLQRVENINGLTVNDIIDAMEGIELNGDQMDILDQVKEIRDKNPELNYGEVIVENFSGDLGFDPNVLSAAVFKNGNQNSVVYRGTPGAVWVDNSDTLNGIIKQFFKRKANALGVDMSVFQYLSDVDVMSLEYFKKVNGEYVDENGQTNLDLAGHSKGGHEAMLVALLYPDLINTCYAFDGQGIPPEMWKALENLYGREKLDEIRDSIYGINVNNDYVHGLGWTEEYGYVPGHLFIIEGNSDCSANPFANHFIQALFSNGWINPIDPNGEGILSRFIMEVSNEIMELKPSKRAKITDSIMLACQVMLGKQWPHDRSVFNITKITLRSSDSMHKTLQIINSVLEDPEIGSAMGEYVDHIILINALEWGIDKLLHPKKVEVDFPLLVEIVQLTTKIAIFLKKGKDLVEMLMKAVTEIFRWAMDKANRLMGVIEKGQKRIEEMKASAIITMGKFAWKTAVYITNMAQGFTRLVETVCTEVRMTLDRFSNKVAEKAIQMGTRVKSTIQKFIQFMTGIQNEIKSEAVVLMQKVKEIAEERERYNRIFRNVLLKTALAINPVSPFTEQTRQLVEKTLVSIEKAEAAVAEATEAIKGSVTQGIAVLNESMCTFTGWLMQNAATGLLTGGTSLPLSLNGTSGIDYMALTQVQMLISQYVEDADEVVWKIDEVAENLSCLRYTCFNTALLSRAKHSIIMQKNVLMNYSGRLGSYHKVCQEAEQEFIQAMQVSFITA